MGTGEKCEAFSLKELEGEEKTKNGDEILLFSMSRLCLLQWIIKYDHNLKAALSHHAQERMECHDERALHGNRFPCKIYCPCSVLPWKGMGFKISFLRKLVCLARNQH